MTLTLTRLLAICTLALTTAATAAPVVHDTIPEFTAIIGLQGQSRNATDTGFTNVAPQRSLLINMFDGNPATVYTIGLGGTGAGGVLDLVISPTTNPISSGTLVTPGGRNGLTGVIDFAELYFGTDGGSYQLVGRLGTDGSIDTLGGLANVLLAATLTDDTTTFSLSVLNGTYNSVQFHDVTPTQGANRDGFDVASFSLTSGAAVPTPGTLALVALALAGLPFVRRRAG